MGKLHGKLIAYIIKIKVAGIPDRSCQGLVSVSPYSPAFGSKRPLAESSRTIHLAVQGDGAFHQACGGRYHLKGGTRRCRILSCIIILGIRFIRIQLRIILRINGIGHHIIVISRIRNQGKHISRIYIRDDCGGITGIQGQLRRCDIQIVDTVLHKLKGRNCSVLDCVSFFFRNVHQVLFTQDLTYLSAADNIIQ